MTERDIIDGYLIVTQEKTKQPLRIVISGRLAELVDRIRTRKALHKIVTGALLTNAQGKRLTAAVLRNHFDDAKKAAIESLPEMTDAI